MTGTLSLTQILQNVRLAVQPKGVVMRPPDSDCRSKFPLRGGYSPNGLKAP